MVVILGLLGLSLMCISACSIPNSSGRVELRLVVGFVSCPCPDMAGCPSGTTLKVSILCELIKDPSVNM